MKYGYALCFLLPLTCVLYDRNVETRRSETKFPVIAQSSYQKHKKSKKFFHRFCWRLARIQKIRKIIFDIRVTNWQHSTLYYSSTKIIPTTTRIAVYPFLSNLQLLCVQRRNGFHEGHVSSMDVIVIAQFLCIICFLTP